MDAEKTVGISFRVTPRMKRMLEAAAERERRSFTNMLEVLVEDYCSRHCIEVQQSGDPKKVALAGKKIE